MIGLPQTGPGKEGPIVSTLSEEKFGGLRSLDALSPRGLAGKREYVLSLEGRADSEATLLLVECLADESGYMRDLAEAALVRLDAPAQVLVPLLSHGLWYTRVSAARTLGRLRARGVADGLAHLTSDANHSVAREAALALARIGVEGGSVAVARAIHRLPEGERARALREITLADRDAADQVETLFRHREIMLADEEDLLSDDEAVVRASDEGVAWEILTSGRPAPAPRG